MKHTIKVHTKKKSYTIYGDDDKTLLETLIENGFSIDSPCGGYGTCGKCKIQVQGAVTGKTLRETALLTSSDGREIRLACQVYPRGNLSVRIDEHSAYVAAPVFKSRKIKILPNVNISKAPTLGIAFDIGTTGITAALYDLKSGIKLNEICDENTQKVYGADIISRISYSISHNNNKSKLAHILREQLNKLTTLLHKRKSEVYYITIAANTAILHFLCGKSVDGIAQAPYVPENTFGYELPATELGIKCKNATVFLLPAISAFVGADITAGLLVSRIHKKHNFSLLVDIGTNGEMAGGNRHGILCCSTAAGPAFEGAGLSCGMAARSGAINYIDFQAGKMKIKTIDNTEPVGICGSGIIDLLAMLIRYNAMDSSGRLLPKNETNPVFRNNVEGSKDGVVFHITDKVYVTARDIRTIQLSKAAVRAGLETLLCECDKSYNDVYALYLAGAFGSFIRRESAVAIRLIPPELLTRIIPVGNSSLEGAAQALLSRRMKTELLDICKKTESIELSGSELFFNHYIEAMSFE